MKALLSLLIAFMFCLVVGVGTHSAGAYTVPEAEEVETTESEQV